MGCYLNLAVVLKHLHPRVCSMCMHVHVCACVCACVCGVCVYAVSCAALFLKRLHQHARVCSVHAVRVCSCT